MQPNSEILTELLTISPLLAELPKKNVFTVPDGYFDSISSTVLACINEPGNTFLPAVEDESLPAGYFDNLAASILDKIKSGDNPHTEIIHLSPLLASLQKVNVFEVPQGYFQQLESSVTRAVANVSAADELKALSPTVSSISKANVFSVPAGYFEQNIENTVGNVLAENEALPQSIAGLKDKNVFEVPDNYFAELPGIILAKTKPAAKVVRMPRRSSIVKYAVAAAVVGIIGFGISKYDSNNGSTVAPASTKGVVTASLDASIEKGKAMSDQQFNEAMNSLSEDDITKYLESHGDITDIAALGNTLDENQLPSQDDYLLDNKTLENYLDKINATTKDN